MLIFSFSDEMQTGLMNTMDAKELEKKDESDINQSDEEVCSDF